MKNDSIVRKQMMLYMATIAIFVAVVCGALTILYTKHYMAEKREELIQQGEKIAQAYKKGYRTGNLSELSYELQILESYMGSGVLVINENGEVALASPGFNDEFLGDNRISQTLIERVQNRFGTDKKRTGFRYAHAGGRISVFGGTSCRNSDVPFPAGD